MCRLLEIPSLYRVRNNVHFIVLMQCTQVEVNNALQVERWVRSMSKLQQTNKLRCQLRQTKQRMHVAVAYLQSTACVDDIV